MASKHNIDEWKGKVINDWTVICRMHKPGTTSQCWKVLCQCGREKIIRASHVVLGYTKACGVCNSGGGQYKKSPNYIGGEFISSTLWSHWKRGAMTRKIEFDVTIPQLEELVRQQKWKCVYTGETLTFPQFHRDWTNNASLDRRDSSVGYIIGNCQFVTKKINTAKHVLGHDDFIALCHRVARYSPLRPLSTDGFSLHASSDLRPST